MRVAILQSNYIPWKGYFDLIRSVDIFVFYDQVKYTKNDWRNRNKICSPNGLQWLTIPIEANSVKKMINEVLIVDDQWQRLHLKTLRQAYCRAPFFSVLEPILYDIYLKQKWGNLSNLNQDIVKKISSHLGLTTKIIDSQKLEIGGDRIARLLGILKKLGATEYLTGPSARAYLHEHETLFSEAGIRLFYKEYNGYPEYNHHCKPHCHEVSILDLLAWVNPADYIKCITSQLPQTI